MIYDEVKTTVYITKDGKEFEDEDEAFKHGCKLIDDEYKDVLYLFTKEYARTSIGDADNIHYIFIKKEVGDFTDVVEAIENIHWAYCGYDSPFSFDGCKPVVGSDLKLYFNEDDYCWHNFSEIENQYLNMKKVFDNFEE